MDSQTPIPDTPQSAPAPTPIATPAPAPIAAPAPAMPANDSSSGSGSFNAFVKNTNWIEVGMMVLGVAALIYTIHYYRYKLKEDKVANNDMQKQVDELKMNVQSAMKGKYQTL